MADYTSTKSGFQKAMEWSLTGPPDDAKNYAEATATPNFYHIMNSQRLDYGPYVDSLIEWRGKVSEYKPVVHEFLRDGDQLAARMTGTIKLDDIETAFESFMFGKVEGGSGRLEWLCERSVWGAVGKPWEEGVER